MNKILLVDDDLELTQLLTEILTLEGFDVTVAEDGEEGLLRLAEQAFDLVLLDVMMPRLNGFAMLTRLRKTHDTPVLMLTARGDDVDRIVGLELGADDYVPKPCTPRELVARLRAILRRSGEPAGADGAAGPLSVGALVMWPQMRRAQWQGQPLALTSTEFNLLELLARNAGRVVGKPELSEQGLGRPLARFDRSIDVHLSSIRHKLGVRPDGRSWIETVRGQGYLMVRE